MRNSYTAPTKKAMSEDGYKTAIVEKIPPEWGLGDSVLDMKDKGFEIAEDGPRRVTMRMPIAEFKKMENEVRQEAELRLKAKADLGRGYTESIKTSEVAVKQIADTMPDTIDLDE